MPSILGLTTDPSPHAISNQNGKTNNGNFSTALTTRGSGAITGGATSSPGNKKAPKESQNDGDDNGGRKNNILARNQDAAEDMESRLWSALCNKPMSALKYMGKDAVIASSLLFGDPEPRSKSTEPSLKESLEDCTPFLSYKMHESQVVEIGLMAVAIAYRVTLFQQTGSTEKKGELKFKTVEATVLSSWRQVAGGDWELAAMHAG